MLRVSGHLGKFLPVRLGLWTLRGEFCEVLDRLCGRRLVALLERRGGDVLPTVEVVRVNGDRLAVLGDGAFVVVAVEEGVSEGCANVGRVGLDGPSGPAAASDAGRADATCAPGLVMELATKKPTANPSTTPTAQRRTFFCMASGRNLARSFPWRSEIGESSKPGRTLGRRGEMIAHGCEFQSRGQPTAARRQRSGCCIRLLLIATGA